MEDAGKCRFRIHLSDEIGRKKGKSELLLEAANGRVKEKWVSRLKGPRNPSEELIVEGYVKVSWIPWPHCSAGHKQCYAMWL